MRNFEQGSFNEQVKTNESEINGLKNSSKEALLSILDNKERENIQKETGELLSEEANNTHLMVELKLAQMFGIDNIEAIKNDFTEPFSLSGVMSEMDDFYSLAA